MNFASIKAEVESLLRLDLVSDAAREANGDLVLNVRRQLDTEIKNVSRQENGYRKKG